MYIVILFVNLNLFNFCSFYCKYVFFTDNVNLVFSHLHPPPRTVALIRHRLPLLPFPSQFIISCLLLWCQSLMDMSWVILCVLHNFYFLVCHCRTWKPIIHTNILCKWTLLSLVIYLFVFYILYLTVMWTVYMDK